MGAVNIGDQRITFDYKQPAKAEEFNSLARDLVDSAIFRGAELSLIAANTQLQITPFALGIAVDAFLPSFPNNKLVRVETLSPLALPIALSADHIALTPLAGVKAYVYCYLDWQDAFDVWLSFDVEDVTSGNIDPTAARPTLLGMPIVIFGTVTFNGAATAFTEFTTEGRTLGINREYIANELFPAMELLATHSRFLQQQVIGGF